jgi:hypothetical protein
MPKMDAEIKKYNYKFEPPVKKVVEGLRIAVLDADSEIEETIKWKNLFFIKNGYLCAIVAHKNHVNLEFWKGVDLIKKGYEIEGTGKSIRHNKYYEVKRIKKAEIKKLVKDAIKINEG